MRSSFNCVRNCRDCQTISQSSQILTEKRLRLTIIHLTFFVQFMKYVREMSTRTPHCAILAWDFPHNTRLTVIFPAGYAISQPTVPSKIKCIKPYPVHIGLPYSLSPNDIHSYIGQLYASSWPTSLIRFLRCTWSSWSTRPSSRGVYSRRRSILSRSRHLHRSGRRRHQQLADGDAALCLGFGAVNGHRIGDEPFELEDAGPVGGTMRHAPGNSRAQQRVVVVEFFPY